LTTDYSSGYANSHQPSNVVRSVGGRKECGRGRFAECIESWIGSAVHIVDRNNKKNVVEVLAAAVGVRM